MAVRDGDAANVERLARAEQLCSWRVQRAEMRNMVD
jgi:hypothetical protein